MSIEQIGLCVLMAGALIVVAAVVLWPIDTKIHVDPTESERAYERMAKRRDSRRSPRPAAGLYALRGEVITCEGKANHEIAEFMVSVRAGEPQNCDEQIGSWRQEPVRSGTDARMCVCDRCGGRFYDGMAGFHFKDGWR